jgi:hypothetical protein
MRSVAGRVHVSWVVILLLVLSTTIFGGPAQKAAAKKPPAAKAPAAKAPALPVVVYSLTQMALPDTSSLPLALPLPDPYVWDKFAWQSFIAMNWPAIQPDEGNGYVRGWPDNGRNFVCAGTPGTGTLDLSENALVWETFKEKREVFNHDATTEEAAKPKQWSYDYDYPVDSVDGIGKFLTEGINFVALDETVEVASQAREVGALVPDAAAKAFTPVFPRVYRGSPAPPAAQPGNAIRYEVKVNYDFFKYVVDNKFYFDENTYARSLQNPPAQLPWRTTSVSPGVKFYTQKPAKTNYVSGYSAAQYQKIYQNGPMKGETPPEIGAVHIKAAWVPIKEIEKDNFLHRTSTYFVAGQEAPQTGLFGLVGLHIIQRIKVTPVLAVTGGNANPTPTLNSAPTGGTFIYATWEHVEIDPPDPRVKKQQYTYENLYFDPQGNVTKDGHGPYPVERLYQILEQTQTANHAFWDQIAAVNCGTSMNPVKPVWLNYRLVGVQFLPVNITSDATDADIQASNLTDPGAASGLPYYLANLFVETNKGLQHFQGLPPLTTPANQFTDLSPISPPPPPPPAPQPPPPFYDGNLAGVFNHKKQNVAYGGSLYTMGGCMGCHGVAQLKGYSFSFVLLGGQQGAGVDTESKFDPPPPPVPNKYLLSGGAVTMLNTFFKEYLAFNDAQAVHQKEKDVLTIVGVSTPPGERLRFGDQVYLFERGSGGQFLTATDNVRGPDTDVKAVSFQPSNTVPGAVWILYNAMEPGSTSEITSLASLSFKNASILVRGNASYLTTLTYPSGANDFVNVTDHASPTTDSLELWNLTRKR